MGQVLAVIGGSGLYEMEGLEQVQEFEVTTPFGEPSAPVVRGRLGDTTIRAILQVESGGRGPSSPTTP